MQDSVGIRSRRLPDAGLEHGDVSDVSNCQTALTVSLGERGERWQRPSLVVIWLGPSESSKVALTVVSAEIVAAQEGIGAVIWTARNYGRTEWIFVGTIMLGILGFCSH